MAIWQFFEKTISSPSASPPAKTRPKQVIVPTIVVTPVLEASSLADEEDPFEAAASLKAFEAVTITTTALPTPPASPPARARDMGLGILGVEVGKAEQEVKEEKKAYDPLCEVEDLLEILGLSVEEERDEVEDEVEILLRGMDAHASKLVEKSKARFLELSQEWKGILERDYLPAKREAKLIISESYAMEEHQKSATRKKNTGEEVQEEISDDDKLFSAIVLADSAKPACQVAFNAAERIYNLQTLAQTKYAARLKDHKVLPLATYRRYVRRVKRTEREMEGWLRKQGACRRILVVGERFLNDLGQEPVSPDSGFEE